MVLGGLFVIGLCFFALRKHADSREEKLTLMQ
jgi:hypothetical protein